MFSRILVTLDGSEYGERALGYALDFAKITGASVDLLCVAESGGPQGPPQGGVTSGKTWHAYLDTKAAALREAGLPEVATHVRFGDPAREITDAARESRADLIVMSTQGLGADGRYGLGSVALNVLMTAPCPLFMVRINKPAPPRTVAEERWQSEGGANVG